MKRNYLNYNTYTTLKLNGEYSTRNGRYEVIETHENYLLCAYKKFDDFYGDSDLIIVHCKKI